MAVIILILAALCAAAAAPPPLAYHQSSHLQQLNPLDYYLDNSELGYYQREQKRENLNINGAPNSPARLESMEPDDEVELLPGAQLPQQPPQQTPVAPNIPGLIPGQRVFIYHMPVPGIRPGTIAGYQPVYVVGAAPQGNVPYPGYQNTVLVNPSGQPISPPVGYPMHGVGVQGNPNSIFAYNSPFGLGYQQPFVNYQQSPTHQAGDVPPTFRLKQLVSLQGKQLPALESTSLEQSSNPEPKSASLTITDSKEAALEQADNEKSPQGLTKTKA